MKEKVNDALKTHFRPEFLNRIDEVIVFHELDSRRGHRRWSTCMTKRLTGQLEGQGLGIELTQTAKELLAERGYDPQLGARPLRRAIQRMIEDALVGEDPLQGVPRRRDHRRRHRGRSRQARRAAAQVLLRSRASCRRRRSSSPPPVPPRHRTPHCRPNNRSVDHSHAGDFARVIRQDPFGADRVMWRHQRHPPVSRRSRCCRRPRRSRPRRPCPT